MDIYSYRTEVYRKWHDKLAPAHQELARQAFLKWARDDGASGRRLSTNSDVLSVKLDEGNRALGVILDCPKPNSLAVAWFFVGKHSDYEHFMKASRLEAALAQIKSRIPKYHKAMAAREGLFKDRPGAAFK